MEKLDKLPLPQGIQFNGFDLLVLGLLIAGFFVGKKRGMSVELLDLLQWLLIVVIGGLYYEPAGKLLSGLAKMSLIVAHVICYTLIGLIIKIVFTSLKRALGEKLVGSDIFGRGEFYLGGLAGAVRFFCMVLFTFSLIQSTPVDAAKVQADLDAQTKEYGSTFFPSWGQIRLGIIHKSATGPFIKKYMREQLIAPLPYNPQQLPEAGKKREKEVWDAIEGKPKGDTKK